MPRVVLLTIPGLRAADLSNMPALEKLMSGGTRSKLVNNFPAVTWPAQANMLTGKRPNEHGVVANGFYWRDENRVEMWTAWNEKIQAPQIWDLLHQRDSEITSAAWFPMLSKGCGADYVCMPAPIHQPDGSEDLWCYTKPQPFYGELLDQFGHFPLQHFWGPIANIKSSDWIAKSAAVAAEKFQPSFFYIYLPHLDYAAQKMGPDSDQAAQAVVELDQVIGEMQSKFESAYDEELIWIVLSEYVISPVDHVCYPNRILREDGLLQVIHEEGEVIDFAKTPAWALVDHQFSHVFVKDADDATIDRVKALFAGTPGIAEVLVREERARYAMDHERSGEVILISEANSWQAYYWWQDDSKAPSFARTVDIHRKPGYDPVELHIDMATKSIPLDATLIKGSHGAPVNGAPVNGAPANGAPVNSEEQQGVLLASRSIGAPETLEDVQVCDLVLNLF